LIFNKKLVVANTWTLEILQPGEEHIVITNDCIEELEGLIDELRMNPLPLPAL
jgi:hypothetical protein